MFSDDKVDAMNQSQQPVSTKRSRALLIGINYYLDPANKLNGCCNDVRAMGRYLTRTVGVPADATAVVTDENVQTIQGTMLDGMIDLLYKLSIASWKENLTSVFFHYSGHGTQMKDTNGDEIDGMDEVIVPCDYSVKGCITDDRIKSILLTFNPKTRIYCVMDCCHSATAMDLPFVYAPGQAMATAAGLSAAQQQQATAAAASEPRIVMISGCMDNQTSADAMDASTREFRGALTAAVLRILRTSKPQAITWHALQSAVARALKAGGYTQIPMLSSNYPMTESDKFLAEM
jgi:metacaspase-1